MNNSVTYDWVKMAVAQKKLPYYEASPGYHTLYTSGNGSIIAFRKVNDEPLAAHLERCTSIESDKLESRLHRDRQKRQ